MERMRGWNSDRRSTRPRWAIGAAGGPPAPGRAVLFDVAVLVGSLTVVAMFAYISLVTGELPLRRDDSALGILSYFFWGLGIPALVAVPVTVFRLIRAAPDVVRRQTFEATVVGRERELRGAEIHVDGPAAYHYRLYARDQQSGTVDQYDIGSENYSQVGSNLYYYVQESDTVRLTVTPHLRRVIALEAVRDRDGRALPPLGRAPATPPGAPVTAEEFMQITRLALRDIAWHDTTSGDVTFRTWTYQLVEADAQVRVYVALGERGVKAVEAHAAPGDQTRHRVSSAVGYLGLGAYRLEPAGLLMVAELTAIGVQKTGTWITPSRGSWVAAHEYPRRWWDEYLMRCAVARRGRSALSLPESSPANPR